MAEDLNALVSRAFFKLNELVEIGPDDRAALIGALGYMKRLDRKDCVERQGQPVSTVSLLAEGMACAVRTLDDGRQMNTAIFVPGDFVNLGSLFASSTRAGVFALTPIAILPFAKPAIAGLLSHHPVLERAILRSVVLDGAIAQEWMVGMGRRSASQRLAHFLCEVFLRLQRVGLADKDSCDFPLTQDLLADTLGLSVVHTNRMLQQLRGEGLIRLQVGRLVILDWAGLAKAGGFDPGYLDLPFAASLQG